MLLVERPHELLVGLRAVGTSARIVARKGPVVGHGRIFAHPNLQGETGSWTFIGSTRENRPVTGCPAATAEAVGRPTRLNLRKAISSHASRDLPAFRPVTPILTRRTRWSSHRAARNPEWNIRGSVRWIPVRGTAG
ncbi:hypothetical protein GCM10009753_06400 [Streptantibioticus ferralitis]